MNNITTEELREFGFTGLGANWEKKSIKLKSGKRKPEEDRFKGYKNSGGKLSRDEWRKIKDSYSAEWSAYVKAKPGWIITQADYVKWLSEKEKQIITEPSEQKVLVKPFEPTKSSAESGAQHPFTIQKGTSLFNQVVDKGKQIVTDTLNKQSEQQLKEIQIADETAAATTDRPWYKNPWYIAGGITGLLGIAGAIIGIRMRNRKRRTIKK